MSEHSTPPLDPEQVLKLKESILDKWQRLPPEEQATIMVEQLREVLESDLGEPLRRELALDEARETDPRYRPFLITSVCRADLEEHFSPDEIAQFDDADMKRLADKMGDWYVDQSFWTDLELAGQRILDQVKQAG